MIESFDAKLPDHTGTVGFVVANTFYALSSLVPADYPMDNIRMNLLLFAIQNEAYSRKWEPLFHEAFVVLSLNKTLVPCLISVLSLYGPGEPCLIANAEGKSVWIDTSNQGTMAGQLIKDIWLRYQHKSNTEILADLHSRNFVLKGAMSGDIVLKI